jgi:lipoate-protein ligase A
MFIDSGKKSAAEQMQIDEQLLQGVDSPLLRFYEFTPEAITYGYFIEPTRWLKDAPKNGAKRPTGGGLIFHEGDFSFSVALPIDHPFTKKTALERYQSINGAVVRALNKKELELHSEQKEEGVIDELCMANPTAYDLIIDNKKVGGAAQRKNRHAFIHQCSLFLSMPPWERIARELRDPDMVLPKLQKHTGSLFRDVPTGFREDLKQDLLIQLRYIIYHERTFETETVTETETETEIF